MIWSLAFEKMPFQFWQKIWIELSYYSCTFSTFTLGSLAAIMFIVQNYANSVAQKRSNKLGHIDFRWLYRAWLRPHLVTEKCNFYIPNVGRTTLVAFPNVSTFLTTLMHIVFVGLICGLFFTKLFLAPKCGRNENVPRFLP